MAAENAETTEPTTTYPYIVTLFNDHRLVRLGPGGNDFALERRHVDGGWYDANLHFSGETMDRALAWLVEQCAAHDQQQLGNIAQILIDDGEGQPFLRIDTLKFGAQWRTTLSTHNGKDRMGVDRWTKILRFSGWAMTAPSIERTNAYLPSDAPLALMRLIASYPENQPQGERA